MRIDPAVNTIEDFFFNFDSFMDALNELEEYVETKLYYYDIEDRETLENMCVEAAEIGDWTTCADMARALGAECSAKFFDCTGGGIPKAITSYKDALVALGVRNPQEVFLNDLKVTS